MTTHDPELKLKASRPAGRFAIYEKADGRKLLRCGKCHVGFAGPLAKRIRDLRRHARTHRPMVGGKRRR